MNQQLILQTQAFCNIFYGCIAYREKKEIGLKIGRTEIGMIACFDPASQFLSG